MNQKYTLFTIAGIGLLALTGATVSVGAYAENRGMKLVKLLTSAPEYFDDKGTYLGVLSKKEVMDIKRSLPLAVLSYKENQGLCLVNMGNSSKWVSEVDFIVKGEVKSLKCAKAGKRGVNHGAMGSGKGCR